MFLVLVGAFESGDVSKDFVLKRLPLLIARTYRVIYRLHQFNTLSDTRF